MISLMFAACVLLHIFLRPGKAAIFDEYREVPVRLTSIKGIENNGAHVETTYE